MAVGPNLVLLSPARIGPMEVRNRIVLPAVNTNYASPEGEVTDRLIEFYRARARGGVGLIVLGYSYVHPGGRGSRQVVGSHDDRVIPGLHRFAEAMHAEGAKVSLQLAHMGRRASSKALGCQPVAPSPVAAVGGEVPRELTPAEIAELVEAFTQAAVRARRAGFDAVEIHMAHGFLLSQFLSPYSNKRTDEYGGSLENRARFPLAVLRRVKEAAGGDLAVTCKINGSDFVEGGIDLEEAKKIARLLEAAGADAVTVSAGTDGSNHTGVQPSVFPRGSLVPFAEGVKSVVRIPVVAVARINDPSLAEDIVAQRKADMVGMGRALICDPEFPRKVAEGRLEEIRPCTACSFGCIWRVSKGGDLACSANAQAGYEATRTIERAERPRRVLVVGGGVAGLESARVAGLRGHSVILYERSPQLGGLLNAASKPPYKYEIPNLVRYYVHQMEKLGVEVRTGREVTEEVLRTVRPEVVIAATGGLPITLDVEGDRGFGLTAADVLEGKAIVGSRVAVIGGNSVGCETAEYLAGLGHHVTVLEMAGDYATDVRPEIKRLLGRRLEKLGVEIRLRSKVTALRRGEIAYERDGQDEKLQGLDNVVFAMGSRPDPTVLEMARLLGIEAYAVGDCAKPGNVFDAVHAAFETASRL